MAELAINNLIKIILGVVVVVVVIAGLSWFFKNNVLDFFKNLPGGNTTKVILGII